MIDYSKWWRNEQSKSLVVDFLANSTLDDISEIGDLKQSSIKLAEIEERANQNGLNGSQLLTDATEAYIEILTYNHAFETNPIISNLRLLLKRAGVSFSCKNMDSYANSVVKLTTSLSKLGISTKEEVLEILPALKMNFVLHQSLESPDLSISHRVMQGMSKDAKKLQESLSRGYVLNEVDNQLKWVRGD